METQMPTRQIPASNDVFRLIAVIAESLSRPRRCTATADGRSAHGATASRAGQGWLERLEQWRHRRRQRDVEADLASSPDVFELEARLRDRQRENPSPYY
jgi:hypothetical protein